MSLDTDAYALGVAARSLRGSCSEYLARLQRANAELVRQWPAANAAMTAYTLIPGIPNVIGLARAAQIVDPAFAAIASTLAPPVGAAARSIATLNADLVRRMQTLGGMVSRVSTVLAGQKTGQNVAAALQDGAGASALAGRFIAAHRASMWSRYDPHDTPLIFLAFEAPTGVPVMQWINSVYRTLAGDEYADAHPLPSGEEQPPANPFNAATLLSLGAGVVGSILIIRWLKNR